MTATPNPTHVDRVDELCRTRDLVEALPSTAGWVETSTVREAPRERIEALNWDDGSEKMDG